MKKLLFLLTIAILLTIGNQSVTAQENEIANKLFYVEFGGPGIIMSANFDGRFMPDTRLGLGYRIGAGFGLSSFGNESYNYYDYGEYWVYSSKPTRTVYSFPIGLNYVFAKPDRATSFEMGAGVTILSQKMSIYNYEAYEPGYVIGYLNFMFRVAPVNGGMAFRVGLTPIIGTAGDLYPMASIGFGYAF